MNEHRTPWRVGRKVGRTLYDAEGVLIGLMDTPALAARIVAAVNSSAGVRTVCDRYEVTNGAGICVRCGLPDDQHVPVPDGCNCPEGAPADHVRQDET